MTKSSTSSSDPLVQASDFCAQTCSENLLDYLGLPASCTANEAQAAMNRRIETLEQQPGKQEYAHELNNLMDGLENFLNLLSNPSAYFHAAANGVVDIESAILTESLDLVFRKGLPGEQEEASLRRSASEYGVSDSTFDKLFKDNLTRHRGTLPTKTAPVAEKVFNPFIIFGILPTTSEPLVFKAYTERLDAAKAANDEKKIAALDKAWTDFTNHEDKDALVSLLIQNANIANPESENDEDTSDVPTEKKTKYPPNKIMVGTTRPVTVVVHETPNKNTVKVTISGAHDVRTVSSQPWLTIHPTILRPSPKAQTLTITVDPQGLLDDNHNATLNLLGDGGSAAQVRVIAKRQNRLPINLMLIAGLFVGLVFTFPYIMRAMAIVRPPSPTMLIVQTTPFVEQLLVNGTPYGSGTRFEIKNPAVGVAQVSALHQTFTPFKTTVNIAKGERTTLEVVMDVKEPLDFSPTKHLHRVPIDLDATKTALGPVLPKIDNCGAMADPSATMAPPTITIHTSTTGRPVGLYISSNANHKVLYSCVERIVSTVAFPTFSTGDYATIEYELSPVTPAQVN